IFIRTPYADAVSDCGPGVGRHICGYFHHDGPAYSNLTGCGDHRRITVAGNGCRSAGHFVTRDGYAVARTFSKANRLTHLDHRWTIVGDGYGEACTFTGFHTTVVGYFLDTHIRLAVDRNFRRVAAVILRIGR